MPWTREELVKLPIKAEKPKYAIATNSPPTKVLELTPLHSAIENPASIKEIQKGVYQLSNGLLKLTVEDGVITSLFDVTADREVIAKGQKANQFVIFDDKPLYWQAWDVEVYHLESRRELTATKSYISENGPHRVSVVTETKISEDSWLKSTINLDAGISNSTPPLVTVETEVEWRETMKFLKVEFPVDIHNTEASYECQFGIVRRPTHYNTSWDMAKFEVCCHKWADLSEANYGVSILNDSKYGFATAGNMMRLSLLRAPKAPDAHADMGMSQKF
jgi:alpha-mannosidase